MIFDLQTNGCKHLRSHVFICCTGSISFIIYQQIQAAMLKNGNKRFLTGLESNLLKT
jgi:hypothetical protein